MFRERPICDPSAESRNRRGAFWCALLLFLTFFLSSCSRGAPVTPDELPPDTTSHSFTWQVETLGDGNSSILYDVAIVSDTLAFAVGEVYKKDSLGNWDPAALNLARWNGSQWSLQCLRYQGLTGPIRCVRAVSATDVWLDPWFHWDGLNIREVTIDSVFFGIRIRSMWGGEGLLFVAGDNGFIAYHDGTRWKRLSSGTALPVQDIWGGRDPQTGSLQVLAVASDPFAGYDRRILKIVGSSVTALSDSGIGRALSGIWFNPSAGYFASGGGLFTKISSNEARWSDALQNSGLAIQYLDAFRGNAVNDVFAVGANGDVLHFNGRTWHNFRDQTGLSYGEYYAVAVRGNLVCAVGEDLGRAVIALGRRIR